MQQPIKFYVCSVGDPTKDYARQNLDRIVTYSAFILHKDAKQKGVYEEIKPGSIVLLKFDRKLVAYGKVLENRTTDDQDWNLWTVVKEWFFKDPGNVQDGIPLHGIGADTIAGGPYGTVKEVSTEFGWQKLQEINSLSSLHAELKNQVVIRNESESMNDIIDLLKYKKQIILQGPPGTGKTFTAKKIANELAGLNRNDEGVVLTIENIKALLHIGEHIPYGTESFLTISKLGDETMTVKSPKEGIVSLNYNRVVKSLKVKSVSKKGSDAYPDAIAEYISNRFTDSILTDQIKLVQFHPAYSYEDFVRGITARTNGAAVEYKSENKILAEFATEALDNYENSKKDIHTLSFEKWVNEELELFFEEVQNEIDNDGKFPLTEKVSVISIGSDYFQISGTSWTDKIKFSDVLLSYFSDIKKGQEVRKVEGISGLAKHRSTYIFDMLLRFRKFLETKSQFEDKPIDQTLLNYVLIIDEINRANLPAVLGELIYALEYRGENVQSMYDLEGNRNLVLPPNLFIIGTMNTADRSVGHIDYAIRRRFAFVDVLPSQEQVHPIAKDLFKAVSELFVSKYDSLDWKDPKPERSIFIATDFRPEEIWIGHSYFMSEKENDFEVRQELELRLKYEILPLLKEYLKDGLLMPNAEGKILELHV